MGDVKKTKDQVTAENAAKKAAEAAAAKKAADAKKAAEAQKAQVEQEAVELATAGYVTLENIVKACTDELQKVEGEGTTLEVATNCVSLIEAGVKDGKEALKEVKAASRKVKDSDKLKEAVTMSEKLQASLVEMHKKAKAHIAVAKKADADKAKAAAKAAREAAKAEKEAAKAKAAAEREAKREPQNNGVRKPSVGTLCRAVWDVCDAVTLKLGSTAPISYILPLALKRGLNEANVKAEYARWKKYNGITGRVVVPVPADVVNAAESVPVPTETAEPTQE